MSGVIIILIGILLFSGLIKIKACKDVKNPPFVIDSYEKIENTSYSTSDRKMLFMNNCASCHPILKNLTGPALMGVNTREPWRDVKKIYQYIRYQDSLGKNRYIDSLRRVYEVRHIGFSNLTDDNISAILRYINVE